MEITNAIKVKAFAPYIGEKCTTKHGWALIDDIGFDGINLTHEEPIYFDELDTKVILRPLSAITDEDAVELIEILFSDTEDKILKDEIDINIHLGDGGNMVDGDMIFVIEFTCRCFEGQLAFRECGSFLLFDEDGKLQPLSNTLIAFQYLQSKGYDLPNFHLSGKTLHEAGLAILKTN